MNAGPKNSILGLRISSYRLMKHRPNQSLTQKGGDKFNNNLVISLFIILIESCTGI